MLALTIDLQNRLFAIFEDLLAQRIEGAIAAGVYDSGLETLTADSIEVTECLLAPRRMRKAHPRRS